MAETQTTTNETYITSQGEILRREVTNKEFATVETKEEVTLEFKPTISAPATHGVLSDLWNTVKDTTGGVAHMAEMVGVIAGEAAHSVAGVTTELLGKGIEKAHVASDLIVEQTKGLVTNLEQIVEQGSEKVVKTFEEGKERVGEAKEQTVETTNVVVEQAKEIGHDAVGKLQSAGEQLAELAEIIIEQGKVQGEKLINTATEQATELVASAQQTGVEVVESAQQKAAEVVESVQQKGVEVVESVQQKGVEVVESAQQKGVEVVASAQQAGGQLLERGVDTFNTAKQAGAEKLVRSESLFNTSSRPPQATLRRSASSKSANVSAERGWNAQALTLTMDVVSHIQRIADRTGDAVLHETARRAHSACAKGLSEAPGVHLTWVTPQQANDLVNLAIRTQDHELADFARYCQSVAATTHIAVEPTPGKIQEEILKGYQELQQQGRSHIGPGYGAAFASVNKNYLAVEGKSVATTPRATSPSKTSSTAGNTRTASPQKISPRATSPTQSQATDSNQFFQQKQQPIRNEQGLITKPADLVLTMDVVSHIQRIADRTANPVLHETARRAHSAFAKGVSEAPGVHLTWVTPSQASELMNLASKTLDTELVHFARYCQSVAATTQIAVEPTPGKIQEEIMKGRLEVQQQQQQQQTQQQQTQQQTQQTQQQIKIHVE